MAVNQAERAFRAWKVLTQRAAARETITYGELGAALGVHHRAVRYILGLIQDHCLSEKLPPLTILIINLRGLPGTGFIAYDVVHFEEGKELVYSYNWNGLQNPFEYASNGATYEDIVATLAQSPAAAGEIMRLVKVRGVAQLMFRAALLRAYDYACAFTDLSFEEALEACHIVPWADCTPEERLDVRNGLLLNSFHHRLFDQGLVTVTRNYKVWYCDPKMKEGSYSKYDRILTVNLHGSQMRLPRPSASQPGVNYLIRSHALHRWLGYLPD